MQAMARSCATSSAQLRPCLPRDRKVRPPPRFPLRRHGRGAVACSASAVDDADVVDLFDAAKLTVTRQRRSFVLAHVSDKFPLAPGGQIRGERHGGWARLRPGVCPGHSVPRHAPSPWVSDQNRRNNLVSSSSFAVCRLNS
jgi:hypothetical protein